MQKETVEPSHTIPNFQLSLRARETELKSLVNCMSQGF